MISNLALLAAAPILNLQLLLDGMIVGAIFALAAYGLALVWGVMNVKNLAQGDFVIMGGYITYFLGTDWTLRIGVPGTDIVFFEVFKPAIHPILGLPIAAVVMFGFGWATYRIIIARIIDKDLFTSLLATFGLAIVIEQLLNQVFGSEVQVAEAGFAIRSYFDSMVTVADIKLVAFVLAGVLATIVVVFMKFTRMGQAIRATAQNARAAKVMGIDTDRVYAFTFAMNAAICGATGALIAMIWVIQPFYGMTFSIRAFVIVVAAGLGNLPGVIVAGLGMGIIEYFSSFVFGAEFQQATVVGLLLVVLIWREILLSRHRQVVQ